VNPRLTDLSASGLIPSWAARLRRLAGGRYVPHLAIVSLAVLAFGLLIPRYGFFWDDWTNAWYVHLFGPSGTLRAYTSDRPILGWVYLLTTSWLGTEPAPWHVFALATRCLSALAFLGLLKTLWPQEARRNLAVAALFLVYPSFRQQPVSMIYGHFFLLLAGHLSSLTLMIRAVQTPRRHWLWHALSLALAAVSMFSLEYFVFLEAVRPVVLWLAMPPSVPAWTRRRHWLRLMVPYALLLAAYLFWRVAIWSFPTYQPGLLSSLAEDPIGGLVALVGTVAEDAAEVLLLIWTSALRPPAVGTFGRRSTIIWGGVVALVFAAFLSLLLLRPDPPESTIARPSRRIPQSSLNAAALGAWALLAAGTPSWITQLPIRLHPMWDRLTLPMTIGASLLLGTLFSMIRRPAWLAPVLASAALAAAAGLQLQSGVSFFRDWEMQRDFFHQLVWRAPAIAPGTVLVTNDMPFTYESDNSLTAPVNWVYADTVEGTRMPYMLYFVSVRFGLGWPGFEAGLPISQGYRVMHFEGNTSNTLAILFTPPGCLQVLDEVRHDSMPTVPPLLSRAVPLSRLERIDASASPPLDRLQDLFGTPPAATWCEYFERADLARQQEDWETVAALGEVAFDLADRPNDASEWLPFIEAYARQGRVDRARELTDDSLERNQAVRPMLCNTWRRLGAAGIAEADSVLAHLGCEA
jgi:hypothetical protein